MSFGFPVGFPPYQFSFQNPEIESPQLDQMSDEEYDQLQALHAAANVVNTKEIQPPEFSKIPLNEILQFINAPTEQSFIDNSLKSPEKAKKNSENAVKLQLYPKAPFAIPYSNGTYNFPLSFLKPYESIRSTSINYGDRLKQISKELKRSTNQHQQNSTFKKLRITMQTDTETCQKSQQIASESFKKA